MALLTNKTAQYDILVTYFSCDQINIFWDANEHKNAHVQLSGYRSENAKKVDNEQPVLSYIYDFDNTVFPFTKGGNNEQEFYTWLINYVTEHAEDENLEEKYLTFVDAISDEV